MQSTQLLQSAVTLLRPDYPDLNAKQIKQSLTVTQVEGEEKAKTKLFAATYTDNDPIKTKKVLEAMQRVYQDYNREEQRLRLAKGLEFIDKELPKVGESVIQAETALKQFRTNHKLIEPEVQAKDLTDAVNNIEQERRTNQSLYQEYQARYNALQQQVANSPQNALVSSRLSQSSRYQGLLNEIQKTELALAKERMRFNDENPSYSKATLSASGAANSIAARGATLCRREFCSTQRYGRAPSDRRTAWSD
jgi:uncharacterized protein involved in exopolysaccharide biosynthesis